jgi:hypothetical protein
VRCCGVLLPRAGGAASAALVAHLLTDAQTDFGSSACCENVLERCPRCQLGSLRIISAITCRPVIRRILSHLQLAPDPPSLAAARLEPDWFAWISV